MKLFSRFMWKAKKFTRNQRGQGMTEYIIIVALIAVAAIAVIVLFGDNIRRQFAKSANAIGGHSTAEVDSTRKVNEEMWQHRNLEDFGKSADAGLEE